VCLPPAPGPGSGTRPVERARLAAALADAAGIVALGRLCPRCGSSDHGRPWARGRGGTTYVSLAYADGIAVAAWSTVGAVGVDVERDDGRDAGVYGDLVAWTRAEAVLKATGEGLRRDPADLPDAWTTPLLDLPTGYVGHLALLREP
jgi:ribosomal protein S27AE